jgi:hypothetical protein
MGLAELRADSEVATTSYQRQVAAKGTAGGAQPMTRPRGPPVIGEVPAASCRFGDRRKRGTFIIGDLHFELRL